ncbi:unnamed protein product [Cylindrotheca closterium]|uniref:Uncharacterized protein n=1 Tax=Cylindrotheca closterium TaxID=2856 RepID=A0AAD2FHQ4_9STRA|nr:unnamed protein product [Cylindrotheca closterium]
MVILIVFANSAMETSAWIMSSPAEASVTSPTGPSTADDIAKKQQEQQERDTSHRLSSQDDIPLKFPFLAFNGLLLDIKLPFWNMFSPLSSLTRPSSSSSSETEKASPETFSSEKAKTADSWSHSIQGESIACTYKPIWDWQTEYFQDHLTNFLELELPDPSLAVVQTKHEEKNTSSGSSSSKAATRVRTKWYASDEYRLIRMTYMDGGENTQIFTSVCYPHKDLPVLGHGLLQVGDRLITISDFSPLDESHEHYAHEYLQPIKDEYPSLGQEMSERFFQSGEFWSDCTLLGRFSKSSNDDDMWKDLWPAYKACVQTHLQLCQKEDESSRISKDDNMHLLQKHADYDAHVASRDPAIKMLTGIFGEETATKVVYEALFPLAKNSQRFQQ